MLIIARYSAPELFGLPSLLMMIDEDYKNVGFLRSYPRVKMSPRAIDRSILPTQMEICSYFICVSWHFVMSIDT